MSFLRSSRRETVGCVYVSDLNATVERLRAGVPGSRFETVDFRSDGAVTTSSDAVKTSPGRDDDDDVERAQLDDAAPPAAASSSHAAWHMSESSPC